MKTLKLNYTFLALILTAAAAAETGPVQPPSATACLSGPVTQGNVTLTCSAIDGSAGSGGFNYLDGLYAFQVRVSSTDPDVLSIKVQLAVNMGSNPAITPSAVIQKAPAGPVFVYTFVMSTASDGATPTPNPIAPIVTSVVVQELKASSSQSF